MVWARLSSACSLLRCTAMALGVGAFKLVAAGAALGVLRSRLPAIPGFKAVVQLVGEATRS